MHAPNQVSLAAARSGEPEFRQVGVGPWSQEHADVPRPDEPGEYYDARYDSVLLDEGDTRNVLDRYRYWSVPAIRAELDAHGRHTFDVAVENWTHDFNIGSMVRSANAFQAAHVFIVGPHKWNRKGSLMTELYQHVEHMPSIAELVQSWKYRVSGALAACESTLFALDMHINEAQRNLERLEQEPDYTKRVASDTQSNEQDVDEAIAQLAALRRLREQCAQQHQDLTQARVIALDIIDGAVPMETYAFPRYCLMLFGAEGPGLSQKALELADDVVYISQFGSVRSINAGAAAAVAMHAWIVQHAVIAQQ